MPYEVRLSFQGHHLSSQTIRPTQLDRLELAVRGSPRKASSALPGPPLPGQSLAASPSIVPCSSTRPFTPLLLLLFYSAIQDDEPSSGNAGSYGPLPREAIDEFYSGQSSKVFQVSSAAGRLGRDGTHNSMRPLPSFQEEMQQDTTGMCFLCRCRAQVLTGHHLFHQPRGS